MLSERLKKVGDSWIPRGGVFHGAGAATEKAFLRFCKMAIFKGRDLEPCDFIRMDRGNISDSFLNFIFRGQGYLKSKYCPFIFTKVKKAPLFE